MSQMSSGDTIAAIATPPGAGGIGIIRISGSKSLDTLQKIFSPKTKNCSFSSHRLYYGHILETKTGKVLDEVMTVFMAAPYTYTREDVVEIHCHGSHLVLQNILELVLEKGCVLASPGQFTKRAFLNGRIDLTQAEAVVDILAAKTRKGVDLAQQQLGGSLYSQIDPIRQTLKKMRAVVEVAIDFPDEDVEIIDRGALLEQLHVEVVAPLEDLIKRSDSGRLYREGITIVIAGLPNVGKSSLLNAILQEERAIVTSVAGTTRDSIEEIVDISGIPIRIIDTAGIRDDVSEVEEKGIERAMNWINQADLVLYMLDGSRELIADDQELYEMVAHKPILTIVNKIDLRQNFHLDLSKFPKLCKPVRISAKLHENIGGLKEAIFQKVTASCDQWEEEGCAPNLRHKQALTKALASSRHVEQALCNKLSLDLIAVDLQDCLEKLAEIVGETTTEDILDVIFEQFCIGK